MMTPAEALSTAPSVPDCVLCVHAWILESDGGSYADPDTDGALGCAYLRTPTDAGGMFDSDWELDFASFAEALAFAESYSAAHDSVPVQTY
jgi:hypothetical protein